MNSTRGARGGYSLARAADEISVREVIAASELGTFDLHCVTHPVGEERCAESQSCSIRPVWMMLQRKIDDVLIDPDDARRFVLAEQRSRDVRAGITTH